MGGGRGGGGGERGRGMCTENVSGEYTLQNVLYLRSTFWGKSGGKPAPIKFLS